MSLVFGTATNTSAVITPPGLYLVRLANVEETESTFNPGEMQLKWIFKIERVIDSSEDEAEDAVGSELWGFSSKGGSLRHKARIWGEAIRGKPYDEGEPMDASELIGKLAKASVVPHTKQDGSETTKIGALTVHKTRKAQPVEPEDDEEPF